LSKKSCVAFIGDRFQAQTQEPTCGRGPLTPDQDPKHRRFPSMLLTVGLIALFGLLSLVSCGTDDVDEVIAADGVGLIRSEVKP
jgi:hypothetical protein